MGGLGIRATASLTDIAYVSSHFATWSLVKSIVTKALSRYSMVQNIDLAIASKMFAIHQKFDLPSNLSHDSIVSLCDEHGNTPHIQQQLTDHVDKLFERQSLSIPGSAISRDRKLLLARYRSTATREASITFSTLPHPKYYHNIPLELWRTMVTARLGGRHFHGKPLCAACASHPPLDDFGYHASTCLADQGGTRRHNQIRDKLFAALRSYPWLWPLKREWRFPSECHLSENEQHRLDIVIEAGYLGPKRVGIDITVVSPHNARNTSLATQQAGAAAAKAEALKALKYGELCAANDVEFVPFGLDIHGAVGPSAKSFLRKAAQFSADRRGSKASLELSNLLLRVVSTLQKLTASAVSHYYKTTAPRRREWPS